MRVTYAGLEVGRKEEQLSSSARLIVWDGENGRPRDRERLEDQIAISHPLF